MLIHYLIKSVETKVSCLQGHMGSYSHQIGLGKFWRTFDSTSGHGV
jgi:hypothetical protein